MQFKFDFGWLNFLDVSYKGLCFSTQILIFNHHTDYAISILNDRMSVKI